MRFRSLLWLCLAIPAFSSGACSCDPSIAGPGKTICGEGIVECRPAAGGDTVCQDPVDPYAICPFSVVGYNNGYCADGAEIWNAETCAYDCGSPAGSGCIPPDPLQPGYLTQYLDSVAVTKGGTEVIAIAGYSPGWLDSGNIVWPYGDLIYAEYTPGGPEVPTFTILDGKPANTEENIQFGPSGWREGNSEPGDDVGKYASIAATTAGDVYIAYSDFTPGANKLKLAHRAPGAATFSISVIDDSPQVTVGGAFYPSLVITEPTAGAYVPVVAYGVREQATGPGAQPRGWVRIATAADANPTASSSWTNVDMVDSVSDVGCVDGDGICAAGDSCVVVGTSGRGECVTPSNDCAPVCPAGSFGTVTLCAATVCRNVKSGSDLVDGQGLFNQLAIDGGDLALAYHDRSAGQHTGVACESTRPPTVPVAGAVACSTAMQPLAFCSGATATTNNDNDGECVIPNGNLWGARRVAGTWSNRFLIDGYSAKQSLVGDSGQHVSLVIEPGTRTWHLAYLDGSFDRIRYATVNTSNTVTTVQGVNLSSVTHLPVATDTPSNQYRRFFIDDGSANAGQTRPADRADGRRRLVGGDISIGLSAGGELRVLYQDMTGPVNLDPLAIPMGPQPLLATRLLTAGNTTGWDIVVPSAMAGATVPGPNSGYWTTQAVGVTTTGTSYCVWAQRAANTNDPAPANIPTDDGATTHVLQCDAD